MKKPNVIIVPMTDGKLAGRRPVYPFGQLEVGDEIIVACPVSQTQKIRNSLICAGIQWASRNAPKVRFKSMAVTSPQQGARIWRIK